MLVATMERVSNRPAVLGATKRRLLIGVDFAVDTALGPTIRGHFDRVGGSYEVGPDGARIELAVDVTSADIGHGMWEGLLRSAETRLAEHPEVRFSSTRVRELGEGTLRVEGNLEAAGNVQTVAFDAAVKDADDGLRLDAAATIDRQLLGKSADRFGLFLPATAHVTMRFGR
jgi:polyisoprenoid-binding protein YceI